MRRMRRRRPTEADIGGLERNLPRAAHSVVLMSAGLAPLALLATCAPALAHTGLEHAGSFASGFAHPWTGLDHVLALLAVGLWAGLTGGRALWAWPAAFVSAMVAGGALGVCRGQRAAGEPGTPAPAS